MAIAEITKAESGSGRPCCRSSYHVALNLTRGDGEFGSESVIRFDCAEPGAASYADLVARTVHEITLNGLPLDPGRACADGRIALPHLAASNELRVRADFSYTGDGSALHRSSDSADGRSYCYTQLFPADARRVFACFDQPDLKAEFGVTVTAPASWVVLSNMPSPEAEAGGEGTAVWRFDPTPRISTYLVAVVAGEYHVVTGPHTTPAGQVIPLGVACRQSLAPYLEADDILGITRQGLDYYTELFGSPLPFPKYDQVMVPEFQAGAMERRRRRDVLRGLHPPVEGNAVEVRDQSRDNPARDGPPVVRRSGHHALVGGSVAERVVRRVLRHSGSGRGHQVHRRVDHLLRGPQGLGVRAGPAALDPSDRGRRADADRGVSNFDGISYAKGGSVLRQLVAYLGREQFFAGIRAYFAANAWGNASLSDLLAALETSSGKDLAGWLRAWLESAGPNTLRPDLRLAADDTLTEFAVLQEASAEHPTLRPHHFAVGLYYRDATGRLVRAHRAELDLTAERTVVPELAGLPRPDLILLNDDDLDFVIGMFDDRSLATMMTSIGDITDSLSRTVCWSAALDMASQAELPVPGLIAIVAAGMGAEASVPVLQTVLSLAQRLIETAADPAGVPGLRAALALPGARSAAWRRAGKRRAAGVGAAAELDRGYVRAARRALPPAGRQLRVRRAASRPGAALAGSRRRAVTGRAGDEQIDAELTRDSTDAGRHEALGCRAAIGDAAHKAEAWRLLAESDALGTDGILEVAAGFRQPEHAALLAPYAEKYFEQLPAIWCTRPGMLRIVLGRLLFPYTAASPELLRRTDEFLAAGDLDPGLARAVIEGRDVAAKALRARA